MAGNQRDPALDQVEPRGVGGHEVWKRRVGRLARSRHDQHIGTIPAERYLALLQRSQMV